MLIKIEIRYKRKPYSPAVYVCDHNSYFQLWYILQNNEAIASIDVFDIVSNEKLDMTKGMTQALRQQYRIEG